MTKEEYLKWLEERSADPADWNLDDCFEADQLVQQTTLSNLKNWCSKQKSIPPSVRNFLLLMTGANFGSVETDKMLMELDLYPEWMEKKVVAK